ncbi:MAG: hypothetical protein AAGA93_07275 [Actinomycetota bacterium]
MRLGLDLRPEADAARRRALAVEADDLGLWAVLVGGPDQPAAIEAAALATVTEHVHLGVWLDGGTAHPTTLAEEVAVLDHLSRRRALAMVDGPATVVTQIERLLAGEIVDGVALTPPPAQTRVPVWNAVDHEPVALTGDLDADRATIDRLRDGGTVTAFVTWPGPLPALARHLVSRAAAPDFPDLVAEMADVVDPPP